MYSWTLAHLPWLLGHLCWHSITSRIRPRIGYPSFDDVGLFEDVEVGRGGSHFFERVTMGRGYDLNLQMGLSAKRHNVFPANPSGALHSPPFLPRLNVWLMSEK